MNLKSFIFFQFPGSIELNLIDYIVDINFIVNTGYNLDVNAFHYYMRLN